ncbi:uncharacterized protein LOC126318356 [Schistocerca gregaria]|uniref:uncharacterized protein LOC126318356 n=1 Tax=Schistocerca gregaria TaxID=7010 RepID=UPI00211EC389|nr:uncharacterized protein LOC126318356 [Schistocerca gregaria]
MKAFENFSRLAILPPESTNIDKLTSSVFKPVFRSIEALSNADYSFFETPRVNCSRQRHAPDTINEIASHRKKRRKFMENANLIFANKLKAYSLNSFNFLKKPPIDEFCNLESIIAEVKQLKGDRIQLEASNFSPYPDAQTHADERVQNHPNPQLRTIQLRLEIRPRLFTALISLTTFKNNVKHLKKICVLSCEESTDGASRAQSSHPVFCRLTDYASEALQFFNQYHSNPLMSLLLWTLSYEDIFTAACSVCKKKIADEGIYGMLPPLKTKNFRPHSRHHFSCG